MAGRRRAPQTVYAPGAADGFGVGAGSATELPGPVLVPADQGT